VVFFTQSHEEKTEKSAGVPPPRTDTIYSRMRARGFPAARVGPETSGARVAQSPSAPHRVSNQSAEWIRGPVGTADGASGIEGDPARPGAWSLRIV
jgi:hypothetical protein